MRKNKVKEGLGELADMAERDHEVQMARADLYKIAKYAIKLHELLKNVSEEQGLEGWVQAKITKAADYMDSVYHNVEYDQKFGDDNNPAGTADPSETLGMKMSTEGKKYKNDAQRKVLHSSKKKTKSLQDRLAAKLAEQTKKKTNETLNLHAKKILGEGKEYQIYLELSEAPIGDVVNKIKTGLAKMPKQAAAKATSLIKKVPKSAWPIAAGILAATMGPDAAQAMDMEALQASMQQLQQLTDQFSSDAADVATRNSGFASQRTGAGQAVADVAQGAAQAATDIPMDQVRAAVTKLGGGSGQHVQDMLANGVDIDRVKATLDRMGVTSERDISNAISRIKGDNLVPMIQYIQQIK